jgi:flagellar biosynthesis GTPase FlhF
MAPEDQQTFTYRGRSLEELVPRIRQELGDDAVIVSRRETTSGGVGGFFAKREIEVEVRPGESAGPEVAAAFAAQLAEAQQRAGGADLLQPPSGVRPMTAPEIDALPGSADVTVDDLFPPTPPTQAQGLAALFNAGMPPEEPAAEAAPVAPEPVPDEEPVARREVLDDDEWEIVYGDDDEDDDEPEAFAPAPIAPEPPADEPTGMFDYLGSAADDHTPTAAAPAPLPTPGVPVASSADVPPAIEPFAPAAEPIADAARPAPPLPTPGVEPARPAPFWDPPVAAEPAPEAEPVAAIHEAAESVPDPIVAVTPATPAGPVALPPSALLVAERLVARGLRQGLADAIAQEAMSGLAPLLPDADPKDLVTDALARRIPTHPLRSGPGVIGFVGPGGAGKTRCVARLAAAHARHGVLPVSVVALRSPDGGAELRRLLAPYGVELHAVESGAEGAARIAGPRGEGLVIVDTPGVSPRSTGELRALGSELDALAPDELHLVVSATIGPAAAGELVGGVRALGVGALVPTHTDETEMLGTVIGLAIDSGLPLSYLARGQAVEAGLRPASSTELARDLVP